MPIVILREENVLCERGVSIEIAPARPGRRMLFFQNQGVGYAWYKLSGPAAIGDGFKIGNWEKITSLEGIPQEMGVRVDFYEGPLSVIFEGGRDFTRRGRATEDVDTTIVRVMEIGIGS